MHGHPTRSPGVGSVQGCSCQDSRHSFSPAPLTFSSCPSVTANRLGSGPTSCSSFLGAEGALGGSALATTCSAPGQSRPIKAPQPRKQGPHMSAACPCASPASLPAHFAGHCAPLRVAPQNHCTLCLEGGGEGHWARCLLSERCLRGAEKAMQPVFISGQASSAASPATVGAAASAAEQPKAGLQASGLSGSAIDGGWYIWQPCPTRTASMRRCPRPALRSASSSRPLQSGWPM